MGLDEEANEFFESPEIRTLAECLDAWTKVDYAEPLAVPRILEKAWVILHCRTADLTELKDAMEYFNNSTGLFVREFRGALGSTLLGWSWRIFQARRKDLSILDQAGKLEERVGLIPRPPKETSLPEASAIAVQVKDTKLPPPQ